MFSPTKTFLEPDQFLCQLSVHSLSTPPVTRWVWRHPAQNQIRIPEYTIPPSNHAGRVQAGAFLRPFLLGQVSRQHQGCSLPLHPHRCSHQLQLLWTLEGGFLLADQDQLPSGKPVSFSAIQLNKAWTHIAGPLPSLSLFRYSPSALWYHTKFSYVSFVSLKLSNIKFPLLKIIVWFWFQTGPRASFPSHRAQNTVNTTHWKFSCT